MGVKIFNETIGLFIIGEGKKLGCRPQYNKAVFKTLKISAFGVSVSSVSVKSRPQIGRGAKNISRTLLEDQRFLTTKEECKEGLFTVNNKPSTNDIF